MDAAADMDFAPDRTVSDGERIDGPGWSLEAIATPGHTANHMAFAWADERIIFSGDHVMAWSTSVVAPPDGAMGPYMASLRRLMARPETTYWPGHGGAVTNARQFTGAYLKHRQMREGAIAARLDAHGPATIPGLVEALYVGLDPKLKGAAGFPCWRTSRTWPSAGASGPIATSGSRRCGGWREATGGRGVLTPPLQIVWL